MTCKLLHRFTSAVILICLLTIQFAWGQASQPVPALTGRVMDQANMLNRAKAAALESRLKLHEDKSGNQVVVYTVNSLGGSTIEDESLRLARGWALGQKDLDNGLLLMIAKNDRKMRIEVGYGLEGTLTDAIASLIIRDTITPAFRQGRFADGILAGTSQIIQVLEADAAALEAWKKRAKSKSYSVSRSVDWPLVLFLVIFFVMFAGPMLGNWLAQKFGREIKPGHYRWLGIDAGPNAPKPKRSGNGGHWGGGGGGWSSGGGGFSGGGGGFGGGGSSGGW